MKKIFLFAATAAMLAACSSEELTGVESAQQTAADNAINFSVYTPRTVTRAGVAGDNDVTAIATKGFGILAYYTDDEKFDKENSQPTFMYNTKVTSADAGTTWTYNPVMYWPNEFGNEATSDYVDYVSFFAYAPYIDVVNETGIPTVKAIGNDAAYDAFAKALKISYHKKKDVTDKATYMLYKGVTTLTDPDYIAEIGVMKGSAVADVDAANAYLAGLSPRLQYVEAALTPVNTVADYQDYIGASDAAAAKAALDNINKEQIQGKNITALTKNNGTGDPIVKYVVDFDPKTSVDLLWGVAAKNTPTPYYAPIVGTDPIVEGKPFIDLIKPKDPKNDQLKWNLRHALSKLNVDIKYIADEATPVPNADATGTKDINADETRIYVRWIKIGGFVVKGALNLNNNIANKANWMSYDGNTALTTETATFFDGRKDGKEGTENGEAANEQPQGLNPVIVENYSPAFAGKNAGVTRTAVNLFGVGAQPGDPIFVIPTGEDIDIEICYDVETKDGQLSTFISDGLTHGTSIENKIRKTSKEIFKSATPVKMEDNRFYTIHIILGMTSVKFEASVTAFDPIDPQKVELPTNGTVVTP